MELQLEYDTTGLSQPIPIEAEITRQLFKKGPFQGWRVQDFAEVSFQYIILEPRVFLFLSWTLSSTKKWGGGFQFYKHQIIQHFEFKLVQITRYSRVEELSNNNERNFHRKAPASFNDESGESGEFL